MAVPASPSPAHPTVMGEMQRQFVPLRMMCLSRSRSCFQEVLSVFSSSFWEVVVVWGGGLLPDINLQLSRRYNTGLEAPSTLENSRF